MHSTIYSFQYLLSDIFAKNERPRKPLDFETLAERFNACVAMTS
jgi:hypothetical protein